MAGASAIEWTDATWNPIAGCTIVSPGCTNCYAMRMAARLQAMGLAKYAGSTRKSGKRNVWTGRVNIDAAGLPAPLSWRKPRRIFVNSMSDLFQDKADESFIREVWHVMERAHWHSFQVLTKRPERMIALLCRPEFPTLPNVWLGTSVESEDLPRSYRCAPPRAGVHPVRVLRAFAGPDSRSGLERHPLGDCRRRVGTASTADGATLGQGSARRLRAAERRLFLQAVGRAA
jgi:protein gp37